ncbi:hypothetical protein VTL71DRAFT_9828 [Oculimacula yallundae]|uniref:Uncharacterized protein n=1 Tax=Oculimacula yallundae TaxID=86028 RepID=A0ABR4BS00_9HELO
MSTASAQASNQTQFTTAQAAQQAPTQMNQARNKSFESEVPTDLDKEPKPTKEATPKTESGKVKGWLKEAKQWTMFGDSEPGRSKQEQGAFYR